MTTLTFHRLRPSRSNRPSSAASLAQDLILRFSQGLAHYKAERAMEALSDEALHDIGVARAEITTAVRTGQRG